MTQNTILKRLEILRQEMKNKSIDIYIIPSIDAHNSEYVPSCFDRRSWISGFDGSAGEAVVTLDHAYLWTDGRYFLQAENQLDSSCFSLMKQSGFVSELPAWLTTNAKGKKLGIDPKVVSIGRANNLMRLMKEIGGDVVFIDDNLVDNCKIKSGEDLAMPTSTAFLLDEKYTGSSVKERLALVHNFLKNNNTDFLALNVLDEIAWLFNIRGSDVQYNPLVISYALIGQDKSWVFVDKQKISQELREILNNADVMIEPYEDFDKFLADIKTSVLLDQKTANYAMLSKISNNAEICFANSPIINTKACKNTVEANGSRVAHTKDAIALIKFLTWLTRHWKEGVDEVFAATKLGTFRAMQENFVGDSFATISGFAENGAIIHYRATTDSAKTIDDTNLYLLDSGGQYLDGTTDVTRTIHLGTPTKEQIRHYTLVLKGHLALGRAIFPDGTCGEHLDVLARTPLWSEYLNYRHGTGHGVGSFLCVHEGPQRISTAASGVGLLPGMIVSNEPGVYIEGSHGIRIENLCLVTELISPTALSSDYGPFYAFETLTLVPYAKKLIDMKMLNSEEKSQLKQYYKTIRATLRDKLEPKEVEWLDDELNLAFYS